MQVYLILYIDPFNISVYITEAENWHMFSMPLSYWCHLDIFCLPHTESRSWSTMFINTPGVSKGIFCHERYHWPALFLKTQNIMQNKSQTKQPAWWLPTAIFHSSKYKLEIQCLLSNTQNMCTWFNIGMHASKLKDTCVTSNGHSYTLNLYSYNCMCSGITCGGVLNLELYAQRFQKLIYLPLFTDCVHADIPQSSEQIQHLFWRLRRNLHEAIYKSVQLN